MSGPIVRKYGFPNFDKIFGERPLEHGVEEAEGQQAQSETKPAETPADPAKAPFDAKPSPPTQFGVAAE